MAALAQPYLAAPDAGLRALFRGNLDESRQLLAAARQREADTDGADPVIPALGLALCPVIESLISGSNVTLSRALEACDACIDGDIADQRSRNQSVVDNALDSIPIAGSMMSLLWSPLQLMGDTMADLANGTDSADRESHLQCASGAEGILRSIKSILLFMMGSTTRAVLELRSAYRAFLAIPESTTSEWARDCRSLGLGNFAVMLSYVEPAFAATFNAVSLSFGMSREDGMALLDAASNRCVAKYNVPTIFATISLSMLKLVQHARLAGNTRKSQARAQVLLDAKVCIQKLLQVDSRNMFGNWLMSHILRRMSDFEGATRVVEAMFDDIVCRYENTTAVEAGTEAKGDTETLNRVAFRLRFELAQCHVIQLKYAEAVAILMPLVSDASNYTAKGMALMFCGGALACLGQHGASIAMFQKILAFGSDGEDAPVGPMDLVLIRKARVNCTRSNVASTLFMHELTYFLGYTAITGSATLRSVFADLTHTLASTRARFEAVGKAEGSRASGRSVEEYMVALFLTGAVGSGLHQDDIAIQHLTRVLELADDYAGDASITVDPYYVPFAKFELGMLHLRGGRPKMAVCMFEESRKQTDFTFGQALWYRSQGPLAEAKKQVK